MRQHDNYCEEHNRENSIIMREYNIIVRENNHDFERKEYYCEGILLLGNKIIIVSEHNINVML